ncbi:MAG: glutamate 5-kinase [Gammaproteobacteria bacterium]|nr:MAG: glutamate 5-kinase [Gammaproteobacteria bacterium]
MSERVRLANARRWVIKIGSALLTADGQGLDRAAIAQWSEQMARLRSQGHELVLVSSGAVAEGLCRLGWSERPHALHEQQAAAAVGQMGLVEAWESAFARHGYHTAQILLTHDDLADRRRYLNARSTLRTLLALGVIPVVNENDTVAIDEIRFGDNDTLAALATNLVEADALVLLTDQAGLYEADPRVQPAANLVTEAPAEDPALEGFAGGSSTLGRGGMLTKVRAARRAARSGACTVIASGREPDVIVRIASGEPVGTLLLPSRERLAARKQWLASHMVSRGTLHLDAGAVRVLRELGRSLLPVGVTAVEGRFDRGELVTCVGPEGEVVAKGLVNYDHEEAARIIGHRSEEIEGILGYIDEPELIHRDNLVLL